MNHVLLERNVPIPGERARMEEGRTNNMLDFTPGIDKLG